VREKKENECQARVAGLASTLSFASAQIWEEKKEKERRVRLIQSLSTIQRKKEKRKNYPRDLENSIHASRGEPKKDGEEEVCSFSPAPKFLSILKRKKKKEPQIEAERFSENAKEERKKKGKQPETFL